MAGHTQRQGEGGYPRTAGRQRPQPARGGQAYPARDPYGRAPYSPYSQDARDPRDPRDPRGGQGGAPSGEPEYFTQEAPGGYDDDAPGHTRAFTYDDQAPLAGEGHYGGQGGPGPAAGGYDAPGAGGYADGYDNVATYRAGQSSAPPAGPRLHWKQLLSGIVLRPVPTFWQMRDHKVWGPALIVTFVYGLLAVFGFDAARGDVLDATLSTSVPWVLTTAVAVVLCGLTLGAVTHTLARQLGGDGAWAPTIGLAMLVASLTDVPRLFFALFLGGGNGFVQLVGWLTWLACAALLTSMVSKSHDLPWIKALGAASIQLVALLMLFKLPLI